MKFRSLRHEKVEAIRPSMIPSHCSIGSSERISISYEVVSRVPRY